MKVEKERTEGNKGKKVEGKGSVNVEDRKKRGKKRGTEKGYDDPPLFSAADDQTNMKKK